MRWVTSTPAAEAAEAWAAAPWAAAAAVPQFFS